MDFVSLSKSRHFLDAKPVKVPVFDRPRLAAELVCLVPEQKETRRNQEICDELYVVIEGTGTLRSGSTVQELEPSDAVVVPPGVERTLTNTGLQPLTVLVALSPKPAFADQISPRRNAPRRENEVDAEVVLPEEATEQAGFDESRSGPSIGRPRRPVEARADDRPRGAPRGGFGPMRRDTFDNRGPRRDAPRPPFRPRPEGEAAGAGQFNREGGGDGNNNEAPRPYNRDGAGGPVRRPFNRNDSGPPRRPFNRNDGPPRRPFNRNDGPARPPFNRDRNDGPPRPPFNREGGEGQARPAFNRDDRPARPPFNRDRNDGPPRPFNRDDRPTRPTFNRDRNDGPPRPFNRDDRPARPPFNRDRNDGPARPPFNRDDRPRPARPAYGGSRNGRPAGGRPYRDSPGDTTQRRRPGSVAGSTAPLGRVRDAGPDAESRFNRSGPPRGGAGRPAGNRAGPARPRRAPFNSETFNPNGNGGGPRGRAPSPGGGTYSPRGAAGRRAAPRNQGGPGGATRRPTGRPGPNRNGPRT